MPNILMKKPNATKQAQIISALIEGNSINAIVPMTGVPSMPGFLKRLADCWG